MFVKKALPLTIVTAFIYFLAIVFLSNSYGLNDVIIKSNIYWFGVVNISAYIA